MPKKWTRDWRIRQLLSNMPPGVMRSLLAEILATNPKLATRLLHRHLAVRFRPKRGRPMRRLPVQPLTLDPWAKP